MSTPEPCTIVVHLRLCDEHKTQFLTDLQRRIEYHLGPNRTSECPQCLASFLTFQIY